MSLLLNGFAQFGWIVSGNGRAVAWHHECAVCFNTLRFSRVQPVIMVLNLRERKKFIIRQPPIWEKYDYDSENSWISDGC